MTGKIIFFLSRRGWKITKPLEQVGYKTKSIECSGILPRRFLASVLFFWTVLRHRNAAIMCDTPEWMGLVAWIGAKLTRRPYILRLRGDAAAEFLRQNKKFHYKFFINRLLPGACGIIPVSHYLASKLRKQCPRIITTSIKIIPTPQKTYNDSAQFNNGQAILLMVTSFRLTDKVNILYKMLPIFDELLAEHEKLTIRILGQGKLLDGFRRKVEQGINTDRIYLPGYVSDVKSEYLRSQALLHVSELDAYPSVVNEARAYSLPVIVSNNVGMKDQVINGQDGLVLPELTMLPQTWKRLNNEKFWQNISRRGNERVLRENNPETIGKQFVDTIKEMLNPTAGTGDR